MPCYHPIPGWYGKTRNEGTGRRPIVFNLDDGFKDRPVPVPCGTCIGCQLEKARQWAVRCSHEASLHDRNCFITLTYAPENLPEHGSLRPRDMVLFLKRLRAKFGEGIRFFQCGEYGERLERPHHHCLLFNHDWDDKVLFKRSPGGDAIYTSEELSRLWPHGFASSGSVTFQSAGYVARYSLKKVRGQAAVAHYGRRIPEYLTMSRRPGIGAGWIDKYWRDVYPSDELVINGAVSKPTRYYDDRVKKSAPCVVDDVKTRRRGRGASDADGSGSRLVVREVIKAAQVVNLQRGIENEA